MSWQGQVSAYSSDKPEEDTALSPDIPVGPQAPVQLPTSFSQVLLLFQTIAADSWLYGDKEVFTTTYHQR